MLVRMLPVLAGIFAVLPALSLAESERLTLPSVIQRALEVAPELRIADAEITAREGELTQAGAWPNPALDVRADDKLGQEDRRGGRDVTEFALRQPIPLRRLSHQRNAASASLESAREARRAQRLTIEREAGRAFQALQHATAKRTLAEERLAFVAQYPSNAGKGQDRVVRYLTPLERRRLSILQEEATQAVSGAAREQQKALATLNTLLARAAHNDANPTTLTLPEAPAPLETYVRDLERHPAILAAHRDIDAARAGIDVARSQRYADPSLNLFRERDVLGGERRNVTGVGISIEIPLWNTSQGAVAKAAASREQAEARLQALDRDIRPRIEQAHAELTRLREQAERLRLNLVEPAREVIELTRRGFAAGEVNVLSLIDASNTYFEARTRYLDLLSAAVSAEADLRLAAGLSLVDQETKP